MTYGTHQVTTGKFEKNIIGTPQVGEATKYVLVPRRGPSGDTLPTKTDLVGGFKDFLFSSLFGFLFSSPTWGR